MNNTGIPRVRQWEGRGGGEVALIHIRDGRVGGVVVNMFIRPPTEMNNFSN